MQAGNISSPSSRFPYFHPAVAAWFEETFGEPSPPQALGWPAIASGENVLILAPTGSGKTLAAFLQCLSWLFSQFESGKDIDSGVQVIYISPLKALDNDIHRNLELPLDGIKKTGSRLGMDLPRLIAAVRTGDTPTSQRQRMLRRPPHILITTPESLFLMLCSKSRDILSTARFVIIDEIHSLFPTKRGVHLSLSLEHLDTLIRRRGLSSPQRIGLSATIRPLDEVARFLGGGIPAFGGGTPGDLNDRRPVWIPRPVRIIDTGQRKELDLRVETPVENLRELPEKTIWPSIYQELTFQVLAHRSTLIFVNNRALAERIAANINELSGERVARVHHGSISREVRYEVESLLKAGQLRCLVATSSLELGIDIGSIDLVIQVESPHGVARGLQRVGRAGHLLTLPSKGRILVKTRQDLLEAAVIAREMTMGRIEECHAPRNCLDVLAQHVVGLALEGPLPVDELFNLVRQAYGYSTLPRPAFESVLDMLSGRVSDDEFLDVKPRVFWDRINGRVNASESSKHLIYANGGTIPDRGYYGVYLLGSGERLGELDEEFVFERRIGDRFILGTSIWQIDEIRDDRVIVLPGKGAPTVPFWRGEGSGRPYELGCVIGEFLEEAERRLGNTDFLDWICRDFPIGSVAARNLYEFLKAQKEATDRLPSRNCIVLEEFQDELGNWRVAIHSIFGRRVNEPLAMLLADAIYKKYGLLLECVSQDDGIIFLCPAADRPPLLDFMSLDVESLDERLARLIRTAPLFGLVFRHAATRALLLPRHAYGKKRTPLWLSRLKAKDLLQVIERYPSFPIVLEAYREILEDIFDLQSLRLLISRIHDGSIQIHHVRRKTPSPFAQPMVFGLVAAYMYELDTPKAERKVHSMGINRETLRDLLSREELRGLLDPEAIREAERAASGIPSIEHFDDPDEVHAWLLKIGDYIPAESEKESYSHRSRELEQTMSRLKALGRATQVTWTIPDLARKVDAWVSMENLNDYRVALAGRISVDGDDPAAAYSGATGSMLCHFETGSIGDAGLKPLNSTGQAEPSREEALDRIVRRFAQTHGPFNIRDLGKRYGFGEEELAGSLGRLEAEGLIQSGEFLPGGDGKEWCCTSILQRIHRTSLAKVRREIEPCDPETYALFLARYHRIDSPGMGQEALGGVLAQLRGVFLPAKKWEGGVLQVRLQDYSPSMLDHLISRGQLTWVGAGGRIASLNVAFWPADRDLPPGMPHFVLQQARSLPGQTNDAAIDLGRLSDDARQVISALRSGGAMFLNQIWQRTDLPPERLIAAIIELVTMGYVANDTFEPVRQIVERRWIMNKVIDRMGRWFLVEGPGDDHAENLSEMLCDMLFDRYGIVTREVAMSEGISWGILHNILDAWEASGRIRRGYFVQGLSGIQYARPDVIEELRKTRDEKAKCFLGLVGGDPSNPWGSILPWQLACGNKQSECGNGLSSPLHPSSLSAIVMRSGRPVLAADGAKARIRTLSDLPDDEMIPALQALMNILSKMNGRRRIEIAEWNGGPVLGTPAAHYLAELGFERGPRTMIKWCG